MRESNELLPEPSQPTSFNTQYYLLKSYPVKITAPLHFFLYSDAFSLLFHQPYDTLLPAKLTIKFSKSQIRYTGL